MAAIVTRTEVMWMSFLGDRVNFPKAPSREIRATSVKTVVHKKEKQPEGCFSMEKGNARDSGREGQGRALIPKR